MAAVAFSQFTHLHKTLLGITHTQIGFQPVRWQAGAAKPPWEMEESLSEDQVVDLDLAKEEKEEERHPTHMVTGIRLARN